MLVLLLGGHKMSMQSIVKEQFGDSLTECGQLEQQRGNGVFTVERYFQLPNIQFFGLYCDEAN